MSDHTTPFSHNEDVSRRFVIFDMFNTLVKLKGDIGRYDIVHVLHESYLSDFDFDDVARHYDDIARILVVEKRAHNLEIVFTEMVDHILTELGVGGGHDLAEIEEYVFHGGKFISEMEGAEETLRFFKDNGYTVAILSNSYFLESTLWSALRSLGIDGYVDMIVSSADISYMKPRKEAYDAVLSGLGAEAGEAFFIGDDPKNDYDGPLAHGMRPIHIAISDEPKDVHVRSIGEIPTLFI